MTRPAQGELIPDEIIRILASMGWERISGGPSTGWERWRSRAEPFSSSLIVPTVPTMLDYHELMTKARSRVLDLLLASRERSINDLIRGLAGTDFGLIFPWIDEQIDEFAGRIFDAHAEMTGNSNRWAGSELHDDTRAKYRRVADDALDAIQWNRFLMAQSTPKSPDDDNAAGLTPT